MSGHEKSTRPLVLASESWRRTRYIFSKLSIRTIEFHCYLCRRTSGHLDIFRALDVIINDYVIMCFFCWQTSSSTWWPVEGEIKWRSKTSCDCSIMLMSTPVRMLHIIKGCRESRGGGDSLAMNNILLTMGNVVHVFKVGLIYSWLCYLWIFVTCSLT